jgi:hypothetical protein
MKRTTIYLPADLEVRLKQETLRRDRPMAELVREAVEVYLSGEPSPGPPGAGAFASGHADTAERADAVLGDSGFGDAARGHGRQPYPSPRSRHTRSRKRRS